MVVVILPEKTLPVSVNNIIQSYSLVHVRERLVRKNIVPIEMVDEAITEYKRYMTLIAAGYSPLDMFSQLVDEVWHNHILFTKDYTNFCVLVFGHFLHHNPKTSQEKKESKQTAQSFIEAYSFVFGTLP